MSRPKVAIIMGSDSDYEIMKAASSVLKDFGVDHDIKVVSAHRSPELMLDFAKHAKANGYHVIIAGAGGAAHLPGMVASITSLPVIGVPVKSSNSIDGWDSILSILQMPNGVPVATVALNASKNAALLAVKMLSISDEVLSKKIEEYRLQMIDEVAQKNEKLKDIL